MTAGRRPRLAKRRRTRGLTQESLATALGADRSTVARWERGQCDPSPTTDPGSANSSRSARTSWTNY